jgi:hypothetical protein
LMAYTVSFIIWAILFLGVGSLVGLYKSWISMTKGVQRRQSQSVLIISFGLLCTLIIVIFCLFYIVNPGKFDSDAATLGISIFASEFAVILLTYFWPFVSAFVGGLSGKSSFGLLTGMSEEKRFVMWSVIMGFILAPISYAITKSPLISAVLLIQVIVSMRESSFDLIKEDLFGKVFTFFPACCIAMLMLGPLSLPTQPKYLGFPVQALPLFIAIYFSVRLLVGLGELWFTLKFNKPTLTI